jgi:DNA-binding protein HU-beta
MQTRIELVNAIHAEVNGVTKTDITKVLTALSHCIAAELEKPGDMVNLSDVGRFKLVVRPARTGRNPKTGEVIDLPAKNKVKFTPAKYLVDAL